MIRTPDTYVVFLKGGEVVVKELIGLPPEPSKCRRLFEVFEKYLAKQGYTYIYIKGGKYEEKVLRKGDEEIAILYSNCVIQTNIPRPKLEKLLKEAYYNEILSSGIM